MKIIEGIILTVIILGALTYLIKAFKKHTKQATCSGCEKDCSASKQSKLFYPEK